MPRPSLPTHGQPGGWGAQLNAAITYATDLAEQQEIEAHQHNASDVNAGVLDVARIPDLPGSKITTGTIDVARVPDLPASKVASGTLDVARVPSLPADKINSGVFDSARVPALPTSKITTGTFDLARVPQLPLTKITGAAPAFDLITGLKTPIVVAHRGGGALVHPEESREGLEEAFQGGYVLEVDVRPLADGTPVACHDSTCDRTMNMTGAVNTKTLAQWKAAQIKPPMPGALPGTPVTFEEVLDTWGGRQIITPETYDALTTTVMIGMINARGLARAIIGQSFDYTIAQQWASAGIEAVYLVGASPPAQSWATIKAAGINYMGVSTAFTQANITAAKAAGLKVLVYTVKTKWEADAQLAKGADGTFSDDPWGTSGRVRAHVRDPFDRGHRPYGTFAYGTRAGVGVPDTEGLALVVQPQYVDAPQYFEKRGFGFAEGTSGNDTGYNRAILCAWAGKLTRPVTVAATLRFLPQVGTTANLGFTLASSSDGLWHDNAFAGQNGYTFGFRRNGQVQGWKYVNGAAAASLGTAQVGTSPTIADNAHGTGRLIAVITATDVTVIGEMNGIRNSFTVADTTAISNASLYLRYSAGIGSISDVSIS